MTAEQAAAVARQDAFERQVVRCVVLVRNTVSRVVEPGDNEGAQFAGRRIALSEELESAAHAFRK